MKAALSGSGADSNLYHQGIATESDDPDLVAATMAKPGVVLSRPVGRGGPFENEERRHEKSAPQGRGRSRGGKRERQRRAVAKA